MKIEHENENGLHMITIKEDFNLKLPYTIDILPPWAYKEV